MDAPLLKDRFSIPPLRPIAGILGWMLLAEATLMLMPGVADLVMRHGDWKFFAISSAVTALAGGALILPNRRATTAGLNLRQAFLLTPLSWTTVALFGALPLFLSDYSQLENNFTNAFFESMSGLTTTGSTILVGLDHAPPGVLLWRALLQWMGGIGIIGVALAILPALGVGGMQLFRTESSDRSEKVMPKVRQIAMAIFGVYLGLTLLCMLSYRLLGMTTFEAIAHGLTTLSTGGYSTSDSSMGGWDIPALHWAATLFMLAGGIPFVLYVRLLRGEGAALWDQQVRTYLSVLAIVIAGLAIWLVTTGQYGVADALRFAAFNTVSVVTTTGYATTDYTLWGNVVIAVFFGLTFLGGCTGSTSGGIKMFRFEVMWILLRSHFLTLLHPRAVVAKRYAGRALPEDVVSSVTVFFALFFACYSLLTIALMAFRLDFITSASGAATALANVGPGLGDTIGPAGNFSTVPDGAKWLLSFAMLLGRLELFTVLILFMPRFWRG